MTLTELSTMAQFNIGAKVIILNNVSELLRTFFSSMRSVLQIFSIKATLTLISAAGGAREDNTVGVQSFVYVWRVRRSATSHLAIAYIFYS